MKDIGPEGICALQAVADKAGLVATALGKLSSSTCKVRDNIAALRGKAPRGDGKMSPEQMREHITAGAAGARGPYQGGAAKCAQSILLWAEANRDSFDELCQLDADKCIKAIMGAVREDHPIPDGLTYSMVGWAIGSVRGILQSPEA